MFLNHLKLLYEQLNTIWESLYYISWYSIEEKVSPSLTIQNLGFVTTAGKCLCFYNMHSNIPLVYVDLYENLTETLEHFEEYLLILWITLIINDNTYYNRYIIFYIILYNLCNYCFHFWWIRTILITSHKMYSNIPNTYCYCCYGFFAIGPRVGQIGISTKQYIVLYYVLIHDIPNKYK